MHQVEFDLSQVVDQLSKIGDKTNALRAAGDIVAATLIEAIDEEYETEGRGRWAPFSPATLARNPRRIGGKLLQDTGLMANTQSRMVGSAVYAVSPAPYAAAQARTRDPFDIDDDEVLNHICEQLLEMYVE